MCQPVDRDFARTDDPTLFDFLNEPGKKLDFVVKENVTQIGFTLPPEIRRFRRAMFRLHNYAPVGKKGYNDTSVYGHLTSTVTSQLRSLLVSTKWFLVA